MHTRILLIRVFPVGWAWVLFMIGLAFLRAGLAPTASAQPATPTTGSVEGTAFTPVLRDRVGLNEDGAAFGVSSDRIYLPDFQLLLIDRAGGATVATAQTDLFGRYHFTRVPGGDYQVCWKTPGWVAECVTQKITVDRNIVIIANTEVRPEFRQQPDGSTIGAYWGHVPLADGSSPWFSDEFFGINRTAAIQVNVVGGATVANTVANVSGEYVVVGVSSSAPLQTAARLDAVRANLVGAETRVAAGGRFDLTLPTRRPVLATVSASVGGVGTREAPSGAQVALIAQARSPGGRPLTFDWRPGPGSGRILSSNGANAVWQPDPAAGLQTAYVLISDKFGGFTSGSVTINIAPSRAPFSGKVVTGTGSPIPKANVNVNGTSVTTDDGGMFATSVAPDTRYVVSVSAPGFIIASKIYDHSGIFDVYRLIRAVVSVVDPAGPIQLIDNRENIKLRGRGSVQIAAGSLVGPDGKVSNVPLRGTIATIDVTNDEMPGDFGGRSGGRDVNLISYGAVFVELRDAAGNLHNLASGKTAQVTFPVPVTLAAPPATIALWSYNDRSGSWEDLGGTAKLDPARRVYVGNVPHFSVLNTDIAKTDASCIRILLDNVNPKQLRASARFVSGPTPFAQTNDFLLEDSLNIIRRLPQNDVIQINVTDNTAARTPISVQLLDVTQTVLPGNQVNTGPATPDLFPPVPYASCVSTSIRLPIPTGSISRIPFLSFFSNPAPSSGPADYQARATVAYYKALDGGTFTPTNPADFTQGGTWSGGTRSTLSAWLGQAGINTNVQTGVAGNNVDHATTEQTAYLNHNDLGFGRRMTIRKAANGDVFSFVTNFGKADQNPNNANDALNATAPVATVAMEYTPLAGASSGPGIDPRVVKFFVYGPGGQLVNSADLDGFGQKFVPGLCQNCHGGDHFTIASTAALPIATADEVRLRPDPTEVGASLREFDLPSFGYPSGVIPDANGVPTDPNLLARFQRLNDFVVASNPQQAIKDLVAGWKALQPGTAFDATFAPPGWKSTPQRTAMYQQVVAKSCRTCHVAFGATDPQFGHNWATFDQFNTDNGIIQSYVCGTSKFMPHALMTYRNLWLSVGPHIPDVLANPGVAGWTNFPAGCS